MKSCKSAMSKPPSAPTSVPRLICRSPEQGLRARQGAEAWGQPSAAETGSSPIAITAARTQLKNVRRDTSDRVVSSAQPMDQPIQRIQVRNGAFSMRDEFPARWHAAAWRWSTDHTPRPRASCERESADTEILELAPESDASRQGLASTPARDKQSGMQCCAAGLDNG